MSVHTFKIPVGPWPKDKRLKTLGRYQRLVWEESLEMWTMMLYTSVLGVGAYHSLDELIANSLSVEQRKGRGLFGGDSGWLAWFEHSRLPDCVCVSPSLPSHLLMLYSQEDLLRTETNHRVNTTDTNQLCSCPPSVGVRTVFWWWCYILYFISGVCCVVSFVYRRRLALSLFILFCLNRSRDIYERIQSLKTKNLRISMQLL